MILSYSSVIATFIQCLLILLLVQLLLNFENKKTAITPQFIYIMGLLFFVRLFLPVEFGISLTIASTKIMPAVFNTLHFQLFTINHFAVTVGELLITIGVLGAGYKFMQFIKKNIILHRYIRSKKEEKQRLKMPNTKNFTFSYVQTAQVNSPAIYGIKNPIIFLPNNMKFSDKEFNYIAFHELTHYQKGDTLLTFLLELLTCFYWWNPLLIVFKKQMDKIIELRVDNELLKVFTPDQCIEYMECLLKVKKEQHKKPKSLLAMPHFFNKNIFELRANKILNFSPIKTTNKFICLVTILLSFGSLFFIIEPKSVDSQTQATTFEIEEKKEENFLIKQADGTFDLYIDNEFTGTINDIDEFPDADKLNIYYPDEVEH
ncbi:MAG: M56 family metallopeptidase [Tetragenococcus koreensis]|nr:M56 family metallopeptidase [Tetragenococcus koreensis]